ncbi:unnamed protein product [Eruca vesicaria subsp. sativa]|uniref:Uncharacterized protein n=1 Tax=Eruca vesicaria subsp. sativa TaxID=29727 RepID=A0ABC8M2V9_ERUVS|nr:unnamed protein product [Eruca vesicaria subsp. sativa]
MEQLIADQHTFTKAMWPGGVETEPFIRKPKYHCKSRNRKKQSTRIKKSLKPKKVIKKDTSSRKQRRITSYFSTDSITTFSNAQLSAMVIKLQKQMNKMQKLLRRKQKKTHARQTSFHSTMSRWNKNTSQLSNDQDAAMETDDPPQSHSPIISKYAAHIHRQTPLMSTIHTTTVHDSAEHNNTSVNTSPVHDSGDHNNTSVHTSPVHDNSDHNNNTDHASPDHETGEQDRIADNIPPSSHSSPVHIATIFLPSQNTDMISPAADEQYHPNSVIYDKSDHPNSPEINHILLHGKRIYDPISPDPTFSNPPVFDSKIGPSSPQGSHLRLSPLPFTPLTSPTKITDKCLALSNTPPSIGSTASATQGTQVIEDGLVDLTLTKDPSRHVPSREENHLAKELLSSPLIPALALITPLPQIQWDLFHKILSANIDV